MTHPLDDPHNYGGLLPDSFIFNSQHRFSPPINPSTVEASLAVTTDCPLYTVTRLPSGSSAMPC